MKFIETHNEDKKPFVWTKNAEEILIKVERARQNARISTVNLIQDTSSLVIEGIDSRDT